MILKIISLMSLIFVLILVGACAPREKPITSEVKHAIVATPPQETHWKDSWELEEELREQYGNIEQIRALYAPLLK